MAEMSEEKRLRIRPTGVASNHEMRARSTACIMPPCSPREARTDAYGSSTFRQRVMKTKPHAAAT